MRRKNEPEVELSRCYFERLIDDSQDLTAFLLRHKTAYIANGELYSCDGYVCTLTEGLGRYEVYMDGDRSPYPLLQSYPAIPGDSRLLPAAIEHKFIDRRHRHSGSPCYFEVEWHIDGKLIRSLNVESDAFGRFPYVFFEHSNYFLTIGRGVF